MNPSSPTQADMQYIEKLLFQQMRYRTRMTINPELRRTAQQNSFLRSLDYQFSDLWLPELENREIFCSKIRPDEFSEVQV